MCYLNTAAAGLGQRVWAAADEEGMSWRRPVPAWRSAHWLASRWRRSLRHRHLYTHRRLSIVPSSVKRTLVLTGATLLSQQRFLCKLLYAMQYWLTSSFTVSSFLSSSPLSSSITPSIFHIGLKNLPFQQILPTLILLLPCTAFTITVPRFIFRFFSLIYYVCPVRWTKLATRQLFTAS